jgi:hypothetical protein
MQLGAQQINFARSLPLMAFAASATLPNPLIAPAISSLTGAGGAGSSGGSCDSEAMTVIGDIRPEHQITASAAAVATPIPPSVGQTTPTTTAYQNAALFKETSAQKTVITSTIDSHVANDEHMGITEVVTSVSTPVALVDKVTGRPPQSGTGNLDQISGQLLPVVSPSMPAPTDTTMDIVAGAAAATAADPMLVSAPFTDACEAGPNSSPTQFPVMLFPFTGYPKQVELLSTPDVESRFFKDKKTRNFALAQV